MALKKVPYLRYAHFPGILCTDKHTAFYEIAQALTLNFVGRHLKHADTLRLVRPFYEGFNLRHCL